MRKNKIAYQGVEGAYSFVAANEYFGKNNNFIGFATFEEVVEAVRDKKADFAFLPIENSVAGRVASMHTLLPKSGLYIVGEYLFPVKHNLIASKKTSLDNIKYVYSHPQALAQSAEFIKKLGLKEIPFGDTAAAVKYVSEKGDKFSAAIGSRLSAKLYKNVKIIARNINTRKTNTTRFLILSRTAKKIVRDEKELITSIFYKTKNIPAALYKTLSGFATVSINVIKLESFIPLFENEDASFYLEFEGTTNSKEAKQALLELGYYAKEVIILGTYKRHKKRYKKRAK